jgi:RNA polymerase sigma factor (sigma-70 family)
LQFIKKYNGNDFVHLPGLIQCHLRYELMHTACRQNYCSKETSLEKALEYLGYSPLDAPTFNMALKQAMTRLTDKEQIVLRYCYEARLTQEQTAIKLGCSERSVRRYNAKALHKLKQILA